MKVQAQISLYPLRRPGLAEPIGRFVELLRQEGLDVEVGPMSTEVTGDSKVLFARLAEAFEDATRHGDVVLLLKVSNTCPSEANWPENA